MSAIKVTCEKIEISNELLKLLRSKLTKDQQGVTSFQQQGYTQP